MARLEVRPEAELDALLRTTFARIEEAPEGTVKARLSRGRQALAGLLGTVEVSQP